MTVMHLPAIQSLTRFWRLRNGRERIFLAAMVFVVGGAVLWAGIWQPVREGRERAERRVAALERQSARMAGLLQEIQTLRKQPETPAWSSDALRQRAGILATERGVALRRVEADPSGRRVQLALEGGFGNCLGFMDALRKEGRWSLDQVRFEAAGRPGQVNASLTWTAP